MADDAQEVDLDVWHALGVRRLDTVIDPNEINRKRNLAVANSYDQLRKKSTDVMGAVSSFVQNKSKSRAMLH